ncbi:MAG: DNA-protecting protein DprA, partial [Proteobacteria bacterium]|nr:DNA-protecting protein DprA [Pseudomonadota bacterium]
MPLDRSLAETRAWLALLRAPGLGAAGVRELVGRHGEAFAAQAAATREARVGAEARAWLAAPDEAAIERDLAWLAAPDHHL